MKQFTIFTIILFAVSTSVRSQIAEMNSEVTGKWVREQIDPRGQLYIDADQTLDIDATETYYTVRVFTQDTAVFCTLTDSTITPLRPGFYEVYMGFSYTFSVVNTVIHHSIFVNDIEETIIESQRTITTPGNVGDSGRKGLLFLNVGDIVKVKFKADKTGTLTLNHGNLNIKI